MFETAESGAIVPLLK